jgi:hypothetical protein
MRRFAGQKHASHGRRFAFAKTFLNFVSEMGRQSEKIARGSCCAGFNKLCDAEIVLVWRRLVQLARFLRCADLDAAMHNRDRGTRVQGDSILEYDRRIIVLMQLVPFYAIVLSYLVHRKINDGS